MWKYTCIRWWKVSWWKVNGDSTLLLPLPLCTHPFLCELLLLVNYCPSMVRRTSFFLFFSFPTRLNGAISLISFHFLIWQRIWELGKGRKLLPLVPHSCSASKVLAFLYCLLSGPFFPDTRPNQFDCFPFFFSVSVRVEKFHTSSTTASEEK